ncbi:hypothetical protein Prum_062210 [Phytohabitans rumicis]|uniref:Uncharacterized protein n=1 Tax=Phytohabitans rumicis TaxID=1076125 RepID=A0A6V8LDB5_9ACTN|nr:hypothetical protein Prum_062210 [Phytohabitans rumicis]
MDGEAGGGEPGEGGAGPAVEGGAAQVRPQQERGGGGEVHAGVVEVGGADEPVVAEDGVLQGRFAGQAEDAFEVPDVAGVGVRGGDVAGDGEPAELVGEEQGGDEQQFRDGAWAFPPAAAVRRPAWVGKHVGA